LAGVPISIADEVSQAGGVPLREVLKLAPLREARVVAGASGLDRLVRHVNVNVMEAPDLLNWVKPNELLLTTAYPCGTGRPTWWSWCHG